MSKYKNRLGYNIIFGKIVNAYGNVIGRNFFGRILTDDPDLLMDLALPAILDEHTPKKGITLYRLYSKETGEKVGSIDLSNNVFNPNGQYIGTIGNPLRYITLGILALTLAILTTIFVIISIKVNRGDKIDSEIVISDHETVITDEWKIFYDEDLNIEGNKNIIYPGKSGDYIFSIENVNDINVNITLQLKDSHNEISIPVKYRLSDSDGYICGGENNWVEARHLRMALEVIKSRTTKTYKLEWLWDGSNDELDTFIGLHATTYNLIIEISSNITLREE